MSADDITAMLRAWRVVSSKELPSVSVAELEELLSSVRSLFHSESWGNDAVEALSANSVTSSLPSMFAKASPEQANAIGLIMFQLIESRSQFDVLISAGVVEAYTTRCSSPKRTVFDIVNALFFAIPAYGAARSSVPSLSTFVPSLFHLAATAIYDHSSPQGVPSSDDIHKETWKAIQKGGTYDAEPDSLAAEMMTPTDTGVRVPLSSSLPLVQQRFFLAALFVQFAAASFFNRDNYPRTKAAFIGPVDALFFLVGTPEVVPEWIRALCCQTLGPLVDFIDKSNDTAAKKILVAWAVDPSRTTLREAAFSRFTPLAPRLHLQMVSIASCRRDICFVSLGYASAASVARLRMALGDDLNPKDMLTRLFGLFLLDVLLSSRTKGADVLISSDSLKGCAKLMPSPENVSQLIDNAGFYSKLAARLCRSASPLAQHTAFSTGILPAAASYTVTGVLLGGALHQDNYEVRASTVASRYLEHITAALTVVGAAHEGLRRAEAAAARPTANEGECDPASDWAGILQAIGGPAKLHSMRKWLAFSEVSLWSDCQHLVDINDLMGSISLGHVSKTTGPPFAVSDSYGPLSPQLCEYATRFAKAVKSISPLAEILSIVHGGVPYAAWPEQSKLF